MAEEAIRIRQRRVQKEGDKWEEYVASFLRSHLSDKGFAVHREHEIPNQLYQHLLIPAQSLWNAVNLEALDDTKGVFGDVDVIVAKGKQPIVIVSCKLSLHNRLTETLFYSLLYEKMSIRVILATPDKGIDGRSEWGTPQKPSKNRLLARRFPCGVYVENHPDFCPRTVETQLGDIVKPLNQLPEDIVVWANC